jgi:hypothetical protein
MDTREAALAELEQVFALIALEHQDSGRCAAGGVRPAALTRTPSSPVSVFA